MQRPRAIAHEVKLKVWNARDAVRGYRYATRLAAPKGVAARAEPPEKRRLELYFDANTEGPGVWKWRHYFDVYERHFAKFIGRQVHVVEVGIFSGGSLPMWREYFGEQCQIYGVDIEPACRVYEQAGISVFIGDQSDPAFWKTFCQRVPVVDVLIDDGGHEPRQQIATLKGILPHIRPGGVYICEDIHGAFHPFHSFIDGLCRPLNETNTEPTPFQQHVRSVHRYPFATVIEKPELPVARFESLRHGTEWQPFL